jgi:UDP-N-acetylmuramoyl-tripeptide--D-alanyl-D-alanine ligase
MIPMTLAEVAAAVGGTLTDALDSAEASRGPARVTGPVVVDSRLARPGALFVALPGEHADGHDFAGAAVAAGAAGVLAARPVGRAGGRGRRRAGRARPARVGRRRGAPDLTLVGITGSSGKTSTKDLLAHVLEQLGRPSLRPGSFNNEIGLPLTLTAADATTRHLVLEMGARGVGHIRYLTEIGRPRIGVVLNVGSAHLGEFGSREAVAVAKGELVESLPADGVAVLNADDRLVAAMAGRTSARVVTFGVEAPADVRAEQLELDAGGRPRFLLRVPEGAAPVTLRLVGAHHVGNALAAAAVGRAVGMPVDAVAEALSDAVATSRWRMEVTERADGVTVVNDAYNANPESVRAALAALVAIAGGRRRTWAVLGEMRELGDTSRAEHQAVGREACPPRRRPGGGGRRGGCGCARRSRWW